MLGSGYWDRRTDGISAARGAVTIRVVDASGSTLPTFSNGGRSYVMGNEGARYAIRIHNQTGARFEAVATVDVVIAGIEAARLVIAEVNPNVPRVYGSGFVKMDKIDLWTWNDAPLLEHNPGEILNTFGEDGWELVQVVPGPNPESMVAYLKRERP